MHFAWPFYRLNKHSEIMKNKFLTSLLLLLFSATAFSQLKKDSEAIYLIVRADDIASSQAANEAIIKTYNEGIARSAEIMVPSPWFIEAVKLLKENPGLDVGVHLVLSSEWDNIKWRPLTHAPSLVDSNGYFFPKIWKDKNYPPYTSLMESKWKIDEVEKELRAQIEMAKKHIPQVSHISDHMGCTNLSPEIRKIAERLAKEYGLDISTEKYGVKYFNGFAGATDDKDKTAAFIKNLDNLKPGVYLFVEHPALNTPEMRHTGHVGYYHVATERQTVTDVFTNKEVAEAIKAKGIRLISYSDLPKLR